MTDLVKLSKFLKEDIKYNKAEIEILVNTICDAEGHIYVVGVGKSGNVARQFASFLASIDVPASFMCPVDAVHGELGRIGKGDEIIILSNSMLSPEIEFLLNKLMDINASVSLITSLAGERNITGTTEWHHAIAVVSVSDVEETLKNFPMNSSILMLMMCSKIVDDIIKRREFTNEDFLKNHPGGYTNAS